MDLERKNSDDSFGPEPYFENKDNCRAKLFKTEDIGEDGKLPSYDPAATFYVEDNTENDLTLEIRIPISFNKKCQARCLLDQHVTTVDQWRACARLCIVSGWLVAISKDKMSQDTRALNKVCGPDAPPQDVSMDFVACQSVLKELESGHICNTAYLQPLVSAPPRKSDTVAFKNMHQYMDKFRNDKVYQAGGMPMHLIVKGEDDPVEVVDGTHSLEFKAQVMTWVEPTDMIKLLDKTYYFCYHNELDYQPWLLDWELDGGDLDPHFFNFHAVPKYDKQSCMDACQAPPGGPLKPDEKPDEWYKRDQKPTFMALFGEGADVGSCHSACEDITSRKFFPAFENVDEPNQWHREKRYMREHMQDWVLLHSKDSPGKPLTADVVDGKASRWARNRQPVNRADSEHPANRHGKLVHLFDPAFNKAPHTYTADDVASTTYEVGRFRIGKNCYEVDSPIFKNIKTVSVEFMNIEFGGPMPPVVITTIQKPDIGSDHAYQATILEITNYGFMAEIARLDKDAGWCYDLDVMWMAYGFAKDGSPMDDIG